MISKQRRQISSVVRMLTVIGVIMRHGIRKGVIHTARTVGSFMDVKSKDRFLAGKAGMGQPPYFSPDNHPLIRLVKSH